MSGEEGGGPEEGKKARLRVEGLRRVLGIHRRLEPQRLGRLGFFILFYFEKTVWGGHSEVQKDHMILANP